MSTEFLIGRRYDGFRTWQVLITNSLLGLNKIRAEYRSCSMSHYGGLAISTVLLDPVSYNVIDMDYYDVRLCCAVLCCDVVCVLCCVCVVC